MKSKWWAGALALGLGCGEPTLVATELSSGGLARTVDAPEGAVVTATERGRGARVAWEDATMVVKEGHADLDFLRRLWGDSEHTEILRDEGGVLLAKQRAFGKDEMHFAVEVDVGGTTHACSDDLDADPIRDVDDAELAIRVCQSLR
ncbi:MAG: hypothetical protein H6720_15100 [Sandaracinus sp.]|nr:hypothetical protein [Sandaracinus sp.]